MATTVASRPKQGTPERQLSFRPIHSDDEGKDARPAHPDPVDRGDDGSMSEIPRVTENKRKQPDGYVSASDSKSESDEPNEKKTKPCAKTCTIKQDNLPSEDPERTEELVKSQGSPKTPEAKSEDELADSTQPLELSEGEGSEKEE